MWGAPIRARLALLVAVVMGTCWAGFVDRQPDDAAAAALSEPAPRLAYDPGDRKAVIDAFYDTWLHNQKVPLGWTGSVSGCKAGQISDAARTATLGQINYFRVVAGLRPVRFDSDLAAVSQRTALMMDANNQLSHDPPNN